MLRHGTYVQKHVRPCCWRHEMSSGCRNIVALSDDEPDGLAAGSSDKPGTHEGSLSVVAALSDDEPPPCGQLIARKRKAGKTVGYEEMRTRVVRALNGTFAK